MRGGVRAAKLVSPLLGPGRPDGASPDPGGLSRYLCSDASLDSAILMATARATQGPFEDVQQRLGYFSGRAKFTPPPPRRA